MCITNDGLKNWYCKHVSDHDAMPYKRKRCSKKKCCKPCGQVKFMGTMTKWAVQNTQNITKHGV